MSKKRPKSHCIVYCLMDQNGAVRYIGQTRSDLESRFSFHKKSAFTGASPVSMWLAGELMAKREVSISEIDGNATWNVSEILWIERHRQQGIDLLNVTRGGPDTVFDMRREGIYRDVFSEKIRTEIARQRASELGIPVVQKLPADAKTHHATGGKMSQGD